MATYNFTSFFQELMKIATNVFLFAILSNEKYKSDKFHYVQQPKLQKYAIFNLSGFQPVQGSQV